MINEQAMLTDLVDAINVWLQANRNRSLSSLSRRSNIAYSTVRRIAQNECIPHPYSALALVEIVMSTPQRVAFLKKHFPTIGNLMDECYTNVRREPNEESLRRFLRIEPHNRIFNIAATKAGTNRAKVGRLCGQMGLDAIEEMLDSGLLIEKPDGTIKYTDDSWVIGSVEDTLEQLRHSTEHFDKHLIGTDGASLMHATGSVSQAVVPLLKELVLRFIRDLVTLKDQPDAEGDVPFFCDIMYSLYDRQEWETRQEHP